MKLTLTALTLAISTAIAAPAMAGGTITFGYVAKNADEARLMRGGMAIYSLARDHEQNGKITNQGLGTAFGLMTGQGNHGILEQHGNNHNGGMVLNGNSACALVQTGNGANNVVNANNGATCVMLGIGLN